MIKVLITALVGTVAGIVVMIVVIVATGTSTRGASSVGLGLSLSTASASAPATSSTPTAASSTGSSPGGSTAAGKAVFASAGCATCHTFTPVGATGTIGPNLETAYQSAKADHNMPVAAFIRQCITSPSTFIPAGYPSGVMPATFATSLSNAQITSLVALIAQNQSG